MAATVLVLGGGFGGIAAANKLRELLPAPHRVVLVDKSPTFYVGATKTWVMLGDKSAAEVTQSREALLAPGIEFVRADASEIDVAGRRVTTDNGVISWDYMIVALGAELSLEGVPGLGEAAHTFYTLEAAQKVAPLIGSFKGGEIAVVMVKPPWKCPPAPYEAAMLLQAHFAKRGVAAHISIYTPEGIPMATAGPEMGTFMKSQLEARGIALHSKRQLSSVDPAAKVLHFEDDSEASFDLLLCVPIHKAPSVVHKAGLTGEGPWIKVNPRTMQVGGAAAAGRVFAIGDVTVVGLPGRFKPDMPLVLPKAGVMAEAHAMVAAARVADLVEGREPSAEFDGRGFCYLEMGRGIAVRAEGSFFHMPHPVMDKNLPDEAQMNDKLNWVDAHLRPFRR